MAVDTARLSRRGVVARQRGTAWRGQLLARRALAVVAVFGGWELLAGGSNRALLPPPSAALADLVVYAGSGLLAIDLAATLSAAAIGLVLGMLGGFVVGLVLGAWRSAADVLEPIIVALNSMPRVALAPLLVIWFGLGLTSKIVVGLLAVFFLVFFNTLMGVRSIDRELISAVQVMGATRLQTMRLVVVPAVLQWVFAALRTSVSFGLTAVVVGEFVGSTAGLGYRLALASGVLNTPRVFSILLILALVGTLLVELAKQLENYLLRWRPALHVP